MLGLWWRSRRGRKVKWGVGTLVAVWSGAAGLGWLTGEIHDESYFKIFLTLGIFLGAGAYAGMTPLLGWLRKRALARETEQLSRWAQEQGWSGVWGYGWTLPARGVPFTLGGQHAVVRTLKGSFNGRDVVVMHYQVRTGSYSRKTDTRNYYDFTVTAAVADADFPLTMVQPQRGLNLVKAVAGFQDIDLESASFNRRWRVVGRDRRGAHEILHPRVMELLDADAAAVDAVTWDSNAVMVVQSGFDANPQSLARRLTLLTALADLVPAYMARAKGTVVDGSAFKALRMPTIGTNGVEKGLAVATVVVLLFIYVMRDGGQALRLPLIIAFFGLVVATPIYDWHRRSRARREWAERINST